MPVEITSHRMSAIHRAWSEFPPEYVSVVDRAVRVRNTLTAVLVTDPASSLPTHTLVRLVGCTSIEVSEVRAELAAHGLLGIVKGGVPDVRSVPPSSLGAFEGIVEAIKDLAYEADEDGSGAAWNALAVASRVEGIYDRADDEEALKATYPSVRVQVAALVYGIEKALVSANTTMKTELVG